MSRSLDYSDTQANQHRQFIDIFGVLRLLHIIDGLEPALNIAGGLEVHGTRGILYPHKVSRLSLQTF